MYNQQFSGGMRWMAYGIGLLLLLEWLWPLQQLPGMDAVSLFVVFTVWAFIWYAVQMPWLLRFILLGGAVLAELWYKFSPGLKGDTSTLHQAAAGMKHNVSSVFSGEWSDLRLPFRSLLVFILIWLVVYLIQYWISVKRNLFVFVILTILFLASVDTFTPYDAKVPVIRAVLAGFLLIGLLAFHRTAGNENKLAFNRLFKWMVPLCAILLLCVLTAYAAPKLEAKWPDPVPFIKSFSDKAGEGPGSGEQIKKMGYSSDDSLLGGSIKGDNQVVFYTDDKESHYWKVESKESYTGTGWINKQTEEYPFTRDVIPPISNELESGKTEAKRVKIIGKKKYPHVVYPEPGIVKKVKTKEDALFWYISPIGKIAARNSRGADVKLSSYTINYSEPAYDISRLKEVTYDVYEDESFDSYVYTQLPVLKDRVTDLAIEITENTTNWYDAAKAIENYFDRPEFVYSKTNIPYPDNGQDYVEQFLFETKRGYCDNYSSAMAVLLRSIAIPSRWVKGYTSGERTIYKGDPVQKVTNNNAHSWVEVYFPGTGWVPFEPTKGFTSAADFYDSSIEAASSTSTEDDPLDAEGQQKQQPDKPVKDLDQEPKAVSKTALQKKTSDDKGWAMYIAGTALLLLGAGLYFTRRRWLPLYYVIRFRKRKEGKGFLPNAYQVLLRQLNRAGIKRPEGQTLRSYAERVDARYETEGDMQELTFAYEQIIYRGKAGSEDVDKYFELWENLIKKTAS